MLETWVMITGFNGPWHHECGDNFQIELNGLAIDGCGTSFRCSIALTAAGNEGGKVEQFSRQYAVGSLHFIKAPHYNVQEREIRFYRFEIYPVPDEYDEDAIRDWIESSAKFEGIIS